MLKKDNKIEPEKSEEENNCKNKKPNQEGTPKKPKTTTKKATSKKTTTMKKATKEKNDEKIKPNKSEKKTKSKEQYSKEKKTTNTLPQKNRKVAENEYKQYEQLLNKKTTRKSIKPASTKKKVPVSPEKEKQIDSEQIQKQKIGDITVYFTKIPAHKFLHIRNYESKGYWDFWQKQEKIKGQDCDTICSLLNTIKGKLDDIGGTDKDAGSGQLMAWINEPKGRICGWGIPLAEAYGCRLPIDYKGPVPEQMTIMDVPEGEYIVFMHGPFDFEKENAAVEANIEKAMKEFDYKKSGYSLDLSQGKVFYFYHDCKRFFKYVRPVKKD